MQKRHISPWHGTAEILCCQFPDSLFISFLFGQSELYQVVHPRRGLQSHPDSRQIKSRVKGFCLRLVVCESKSDHNVYIVFLISLSNWMQPINNSSTANANLLVIQTVPDQLINETGHISCYKIACASSEDSDQPALQRRLIKVFAVRLKTRGVLGYLAKTFIWPRLCAGAHSVL